MTRSEQIEQAARTMVSSEQAWLIADHASVCIWCSASADPLDAIPHADRCEMGAMVRALALPEDAPEALREAGRSQALKEAAIACGNEEPARASALGIAALNRAQIRIFALIPYEAPPSPRSEPEARCPEHACPSSQCQGRKHTGCRPPASPPSKTCPHKETTLGTTLGTDVEVCRACGAWNVGGRKNGWHAGRSPSPGRAP